MNSHIGPAQVQISCKKELDIGYHQEAICNWSLLTKQKVSFSQWSVIGYINHTRGQSLYPGKAGKHKMNCIFVHMHVCAGSCFWFVFGIFYITIFSLALRASLCDLSCSIFICLFILFCFYFSLIENTQRERTWNWVLPRNEDTLKRNLCPPSFLCLVLKQQIAIYWNSSWNLMLKERKYWIQLPFRREICLLEEISQSSENLQRT